MSAEERIRRYAATLGFTACGFAAAVPLDRGAFLDGWLAAGFAAEMRYLERRPERRLSFASALAGARTVISLAYPYDPPPAPAVDWRRELRGRIAAYALGEDYHRVIERRLAALEAYLTARWPASRSRRYVDTGAVLEREWAVRAALGWFGKNTMLLSTRAGSWFFLAELATTLALTPDPPAASHCGRCARCRERCPTGALADGLVMDARLCISYLTIEHRGAIPPALRPRLGPWVFGCDLCQEVCPWCEKAGAGRLPSARAGTPWLAAPPRAGTGSDGAGAPEATEWLFPSLPALLALDAAAFRARYGHTPVARARRRGLLRNAAVALGNSGNPEAEGPLTRALEDPEPLVRGHAAWALGRLGGAQTRRTLERRRLRDPDPAVRDEIVAALGEA